jgi:hypothetical protein
MTVYDLRTSRKNGEPSTDRVYLSFMLHSWSCGFVLLIQLDSLVRSAWRTALRIPLAPSVDAKQLRRAKLMRRGCFVSRQAPRSRQPCTWRLERSFSRWQPR